MASSNQSRANQMFTNMRIGIDFGGVIRREDDEPHDAAFKTIKFIIHKYGASNCFIVSKAQRDTRISIEKWLNEHSFFEQTGFLKENVHFVTDYIGKQHVVNKQSINLFIDDKIQNIKAVLGADCILVKRVIWFNNRHNNKYAAEPSTKLVHINSRVSRNLVVVSKNWNRVQKHLKEIPNKIPI